MSQKPFAVGEYVVYPSHGVGQIVGYELQEIADQQIELMVICFDKDRMILRIPIGKAKASGLRALTSSKEMQKALESLKVKTKTRRTMWSRRAQEYENKINSGDPGSIAEVIRDLYRSATQPDQSYSERQIYQSAIDRFARELAAIEKIDETSAVNKVEDFLKVA